MKKCTIADAQQAPQEGQPLPADEADYDGFIIEKVSRRRLEETNDDFCFWPIQIMTIAHGRPIHIWPLDGQSPPSDADVPSGPSALADQHMDRDEEEWDRIDPLVSLQSTLDRLQLTSANLWVDMLLGHGSEEVATF